jgi:hypothetical protein
MVITGGFVCREFFLYGMMGSLFEGNGQPRGVYARTHARIHCSI